MTLSLDVHSSLILLREEYKFKASDFDCPASAKGSCTAKTSQYPDNAIDVLSSPVV
jgi:hypothetical protein